MTDGRDERPLSAGEVRSRAVGGVVNTIVRSFAARLIGLVGSIVLARLLVPADFGAIAFGMALLAFGQFIADGGMGAALMRRQEEPSELELQAMLGFHLSSTAAMALVIAAVALPFGRTGQLTAIIALALPLDALRVPTALVVERRLQYGAFLWAELTETLVFNVVAIALVASGLGVWGMAIAAPLRALTGSVVMTGIGPVGWLRPRFSLRVIRPLLRFGITFQAVNVVNTIRDQGLNLVTAAVGGLAVLGVWTLANRILQAILLLFVSLWRVSFPAMSRLLETGEPPQPAIERSLELTSAMTGFLVSAIGGAAPALVPVLFGARWHDTVGVLPWAAAGIMIGGPISTSVVGYLYASNRPRIPLRAVVAHTLTWFAVSVPLLDSLGAEALGIGWFVGAIVDALVLGQALRGESVEVVRRIAAPTALAAVSGAAGWWVAEALGANVGSLVAACATVEALYAAGLALTSRRVLMELITMIRRTVLSRSTLANAVRT